MRLLFLQLPRLDPDITSPGENLMPAAACLRASLDRSPEFQYWDVIETPVEQDIAGDTAFIDCIDKLNPDVVAATCYLWNIERTLHLLAQLKKRLPKIRTAIGGPDVASDHPLLPPKKNAVAVDVFVVGEGETVFPEILAFFRAGTSPDFHGVTWRTNDGRHVEGTQKRASRPLRDLLPDAAHPINKPDAFGMAYLETSRGCPMHCAFCCYNIRRTTISCLPSEDVATRIRILRERGAKEIRLLDPTFNAHPRFDDVLDVMIRENQDRKLSFFVEIRADTLTDDQARRLALAGIAEAEVGIQSTDPEVLKLVHRPLSPVKILNGIDALLRHGIRPTLDFMYALPAQGKDDIEKSLAWLERFDNKIHPQYLPTLLLPGTELRDRAKELGLRAQRLPPYRVLSTDKLSTRELADVESWANETLGGFDSPTQRFVGVRLPDLFTKRTKIGLQGIASPQNSGIRSQNPELDPNKILMGSLPTMVPTPSTAHKLLAETAANRQAVFINAENFFDCREQISALIRRCVRAEPHILWQFVLELKEEEPLDLLDLLIADFRRHPGHWLDRLVSPLGRNKFCARRLFLKLPRSNSFAPLWIREAEAILASHFH